MRYYATLGPACCQASTLCALLRRGVTGFRLNLSHTPLAARQDWIAALHDAERQTGLSAQLMIDLRGPEVRIGALPAPLPLAEGDTVTLGVDIPVEADVLAALRPGMTLLLDDGVMALTVLDGGACRVARGGTLTSWGRSAVRTAFTVPNRCKSSFFRASPTPGMPSSWER